MRAGISIGPKHIRSVDFWALAGLALLGVLF